MSAEADASRRPDLAAEQRADRLKERVYVTFTALAVVLALRSHHQPAGEALTTLLVAVLGTVLAVFVADVVSHIVVHEGLPSRPAVAHMAAVSFGALGALALPFLLLGLAVADAWAAEDALRWSSYVLVASLVAIGYMAVRRARLGTWQRLVVLFAEFALGAVVIGLELLAHG